MDNAVREFKRSKCMLQHEFLSGVTSRDYHSTSYLRHIFRLTPVAAHSLQYPKSLVCTATQKKSFGNAIKLIVKFSVCTIGNKALDEFAADVECCSKIELEMSVLMTTLWETDFMHHVIPVVHRDVHLVEEAAESGDDTGLTQELHKLHKAGNTPLIVKSMWMMHVECLFGDMHSLQCDLYNACKNGGMCSTADDIHAVGIQLLVALQVLREFRVTHFDIHGRNVHVIRHLSPVHLVYRLTPCMNLNILSSVHVVLIDWDMSCKFAADADQFLPLSTGPIGLQNPFLESSELGRTYGMQHAAFVPEIDVFATMGMLYTVSPYQSQHILDACIPPRDGRNPWHPRHICSSNYAETAICNAEAEVVTVGDDEFTMRHWLCIQPFMRHPVFMNNHGKCGIAAVPCDGKKSIPIRPAVGDMRSPFECINLLHTGTTLNHNSWINDAADTITVGRIASLPSANVHSTKDAAFMRLDTDAIWRVETAHQPIARFLSCAQIAYIEKLCLSRKAEMIKQVCKRCASKLRRM